MKRSPFVEDHQRQRICARLDGWLVPPPDPRPDRLWRWLNVVSGLSLVGGGYLAIPVLLATVAAKKATHAAWRRRRLSDLHRQVKAVDGLLNEVRRVRRQLRRARGRAAFRESAISGVLLAAAPAVSFLFQRAETVMVIRCAVFLLPTREWPDRALHAVCLVGLAGEEVEPLVGVASDFRDPLIEETLVRLRTTVKECLPLGPTLEYWTWNQGDPSSLSVT